MKTLTLDLGTHVGWAIWEDHLVESGTCHLATDDELDTQRKEGTERTLDLRFIRLLKLLNDRFALGVRRVVFEDVTFSGSPMQNQLWAGLRSAIWAAAPPAGVAICCVPVTTLKVFATGNTRADKLLMAQALATAQPHEFSLKEDGICIGKDGRLADDNEVDAIWLAYFTAAVDRGECDFLTAFQRKTAKREARRAAKVARKARKRQKLADEKESRRLFIAAVRASGRCCGVLRQPAPRGRAVCRKCGRAVKVSVSKDSSIEPTKTQNGDMVPLLPPAATVPSVQAA